MRRHRFSLGGPLIAALLYLLCAQMAVASDPNWPQFRGPGGLGIAPDDEGYPATLDPSRNLLWKTEVPEGHSSPCIWASGWTRPCR